MRTIGNMKKKTIKFNRAIRNFVLERLAFKMDEGDLDKQIKSFLDGDTFSINFTVDFIPNDVLFMGYLLGINPSESTIKKLRKEERRNNR